MRAEADLAVTLEAASWTESDQEGIWSRTVVTLSCKVGAEQGELKGEAAPGRSCAMQICWLTRAAAEGPAWDGRCFDAVFSVPCSEPGADVSIALAMKAGHDSL